MQQSNELTIVQAAPGATMNVAALAERRRAPRLRTVYRVARITAAGEQGLARVQNISDDGMMITTMLSLSLGDVVQIDLSDDCRLAGEVVWYAAHRCGNRLLRIIDSATLLRRLCEDRRSGDARPLRLSHNKRVSVASELGYSVAALRDVSQSGLKVAHDGRFDQGLPVKVMLKPGLERRSVVRWSKDGIAGIALTEIFSVEELGSLRRI